MGDIPLRRCDARRIPAKTLRGKEGKGAWQLEFTSGVVEDLFGSTAWPEPGGRRWASTPEVTLQG
eukprot:5175085-Pyramimonas_sp.AAC.1